ncbi:MULTISPECIES: nucleotidyltransferase domain-containing protein [Chromobacterium]|uniref:nucleotidyltransferase domain-containing protein n=1 Tax=Chromobacterium TaxID=535 RepID=UPI0018894344|nr:MULTISPECIES: nucleotidyltransferase domain-containing protein [Chromobacterium]QOZ85031.1 nucleotidyltransferase domain-containing protein [Chromobacterium sp. Rain0013]WON85242.1 nucleotidyltransferase domain-containing protein [Chromobacterium haemolyticum]
MQDFLFQHPLEDAMRERVGRELDTLERRHRVRVLYACESGSRAWGFPSPDSDYDVRFIYVHEPEWYLRVMPQRDVIELPINDELDISGWELRKALRLLQGSNPTLCEWLQSPLVYRADPQALRLLRGLAPDFRSDLKCRWHYLAMARKNFNAHLQGDSICLKKYLYVLRALLAVRWLDAGRGMPPTRFAQLAAGVVDDAELAVEINRLLAVKIACGESMRGPRRPRIHAFIEQQLAAAEPAPALPTPRGDSARLDQALWRLAKPLDHERKHFEVALTEPRFTTRSRS